MGSQAKTNLITKPHHNISMSKRTRKPQNLKIEAQESYEEKQDYMMMSKLENIQQQKISLKQLIEGRSSCTLAQHFKEEENQQNMVVRSSDQDGFKGVKLKKLVRNYASVLSHLIKVNQDSYFKSWGKSAPSFKLVKHK